MRNTVIVTMSFKEAPASFSVASMFLKVCRVCASKSPARELPAASLCPVWPAIHTILPPSVITAGEYARDFCHVRRTNVFSMAFLLSPTTVSFARNQPRSKAPAQRRCKPFGHRHEPQDRVGVGGNGEGTDDRGRRARDHEPAEYLVI